MDKIAKNMLTYSERVMMEEELNRLEQDVDQNSAKLKQTIKNAMEIIQGQF